MSETAAITDPTALPATGTWNVDQSHTAIEFVARHLMLSKVRGRFTDFTGAITVADDPQQSSAEITIQTASLTSGDAKRDEHVRGADFLDVEKFPTLTFKSTAVTPVVDNKFDVTGDLTIKGVSKSVTLKAEYFGQQTTPWATVAAGFSLKTEIDREDWGLTWNAALESGGVVVSKKIQLEIEAEVTPAQ